MRTSSRRRLDAVLLGAGAAALAGVSALGGVIGDAERVSGMWVAAELSGTSDAAVTEIIDYDFGMAVDRHGIYRTIPGIGPESPFRVESATAPDDLAEVGTDFTGDEPGLRLKIGNPNKTIAGRHRYRIDYQHGGLLDPSGQLRWDAVGTAWTVDVQQTEIHIVAPWEFEGLECSKGRTGATGGCELQQVEPGHLVAKVGKLSSGEGVTVSARRGADIDATPALPTPPTKAPPDPGGGLARPAAVAAIAGLGASATASRLVRRAGRERVGTGGAADAAWAGEDGGPTSEVRMDEAELEAMTTTEFAPPYGITAPMGGIILDEKVKPNHKVAWLLETAIGGGVDLIEEDNGKVRLVRLSGGPTYADQPLNRMFGGRREITLGKYDPKFAAGWREVDQQLAGWKRQSGLWDPHASARAVTARVFGGLIGGVAFLGVGLFGAFVNRWGLHWLPFSIVCAVLAGAGLATAIRGWELKVRTPQGSGLWLRVASFRNFLAHSEAHHVEEAAKRGVLREYTAWAVALGEIDRWQRAVNASSVSDQAGLGYVHMAPVLVSSTSSTATAPSSSGGGGGGSVGGGGGGGGGGSW